MDTNAALQPTGSSDNTTTGNPQQLVGSGLQQQPSNGLQTAASQSVTDLNTLDQGGASIPLAQVSTTSTTATTVSAPAKPYHVTSNTVLYAGLGLVVIIFIVYLGWGLMHKKA